MSSKKSKFTRPTKRRARKTTERPTPAAERMACLLKLFNERALTGPASPLVHGRTPLEVVKNCRELAEWLYRQALDSPGYERGGQHVYLMLVGALNFLERQLTPVFETAEQIASEVRL